jgi:outer membrane lipoprotein SlyB
MKSIAAMAFAAVLPAMLASVHAEPAPTVSVPTAEQRGALCDGCAWVQEVRTETRDAKASGLGVVGGAVVGGLLGSQVGGGTGKKLATVGGAVAGGYAGNQVEKNARQRKVWIVHLVNRDGSQRSVELDADPNLRPGDTVREKDGQLTRP